MQTGQRTIGEAVVNSSRSPCAIAVVGDAGLPGNVTSQRAAANALPTLLPVSRPSSCASQRPVRAR
ncbi:hypothetical protein, partial [Xanthomonas oryzae]|uniref:hypothetical protein n=1 Tax=Xanthomonas oryzae TaxID=347 RepID=UPI001C677CEB